MESVARARSSERASLPYTFKGNVSRESRREAGAVRAHARGRDDERQGGARITSGGRRGGICREGTVIGARQPPLRIYLLQFIAWSALTVSGFFDTAVMTAPSAVFSTVRVTSLPAIGHLPQEQPSLAAFARCS